MLIFFILEIIILELLKHLYAGSVSDRILSNLNSKHVP